MEKVTLGRQGRQASRVFQAPQVFQGLLVHQVLREFLVFQALWDPEDQKVIWAITR